MNLSFFNDASPIMELTAVKDVLVDQDAIDENAVVINTPAFKKKSGVVLFYSPNCGHCKDFKPTFLELGNQLGNTVPLGAFNCIDFEGKNNILSEYLDIAGYPTIKFYDHRNHAFIDYEGPRNIKSIVGELCKQGICDSATARALGVQTNVIGMFGGAKRRGLRSKRSKRNKKSKKSKRSKRNKKSKKSKRSKRKKTKKSKRSKRKKTRKSKRRKSKQSGGAIFKAGSTMTGGANMWTSEDPMSKPMRGSVYSPKGMYHHRPGVLVGVGMPRQPAAGAYTYKFPGQSGGSSPFTGATPGMRAGVVQEPNIIPAVGSSTFMNGGIPMTGGFYDPMVTVGGAKKRKQKKTKKSKKSRKSRKSKKSKRSRKSRKSRKTRKSKKSSKSRKSKKSKKTRKSKKTKKSKRSRKSKKTKKTRKSKKSKRSRRGSKTGLSTKRSKRSKRSKKSTRRRRSSGGLTYGGIMNAAGNMGGDRRVPF
jgi:thiol-disulfide isomerase/thioredoxin